MANNAQMNGKLLQQIVAGDSKAEEHLCKKYRDKVLFIIRRKIRDIEDASDICQEILIATITAARNAKIQNPEKFSSFIYSICHNKINDYLKHQYQKSKVALSEVEKQLLASDRNALDGIVSDEIRTTIDHSLKKLNTRERRILYLKYICEWSSARIGEQLSLKPVLVRKITERAIKKIRKML